jgi:hypothetical protein
LKVSIYDTQIGKRYVDDVCIWYNCYSDVQGPRMTSPSQYIQLKIRPGYYPMFKMLLSLNKENYEERQNTDIERLPRVHMG